MPIHVLDKAYTVNQSGGVAAHRVVVQATTAGQCQYPGGAGGSAGTLLGVTQDEAADGRAVAVRKAGIALVEAAGAITVGDLVEAADTAGRVQAAAINPGATTEALGWAETAATAAGDLIEVFLAPQRAAQPN